MTTRKVVATVRCHRDFCHFPQPFIRRSWVKRGLEQLLFITFSALLIFAIPATTRSEEYTFVTFHYPPLEFAERGQYAMGGITEVVRRVMTHLGHQVTITVYPWTRALKMVKNGNADAIFTAYKNPEREKFLDYSQEVLFPQAVYFYKKAGNSLQFNGDLNLLADKKIGVVSTISYGQIFEFAKSSLHLDRANNLEQSFHKLLKDRIDLVPSDLNVADYTLRQLGLTGAIVRLPQKLESVPSFIAFSKKRRLKKLLQKFDQELRVMKATGEYQAILRDHEIQFFEE